MSVVSGSVRRGSTLIELLVVLAILATVTALVGLAFTNRAPMPPSAAERIAVARRSAILSGRAVTIAFVQNSDSLRAVALPDGSIVGAELVRIDRASGRPSDAR